MKELDIHKRFKVVVRQSTGKVQQIHETTGSAQTEAKIHEELSWIVNHPGSKGNTLTITMLED